MSDETSPQLLLDLIDTLFAADARGRLIGDGPRLYLLRTRETVICRAHAALPEELAAALDDVARRPRGRPRGWARDYADHLGLLATAGSPRSIRAGPLYGFPDNLGAADGCVAIDAQNAGLLRGGLEEWAPDVALDLPMTAVVAKGRAVAICASVRASERVHCAGVETLPAYRGREFGAKAVASWAKSVSAMGAPPFYATTFDNLASQGLPARLSLNLIGTEFSVD